MKRHRILSFSISLCLGWVLLLLLGLVLPRPGAGNAGATCAAQICVIRYGYHAKLIVPIQSPSFDWRDSLRPLGVDVGDAQTRYLGFGWGARDWYMNPPTTLGQTIVGGARSLLLPNRSVMKVQRYREFPTADPHQCIAVTPAHLEQVRLFVEQSFQRNSQGQVQYRGVDTRHHGTYYDAKGTYSLFDNCNHWTARALHLAGIDTPRWAAHAAAIMRLLRSTC